jgi:hypothetical protein
MILADFLFRQEVVMLDTLFHLYQRGTVPFRSICALPDDEAIDTMRGLYREGSVFWERFQDPAMYLHLRRQVEAWVLQEFIAKGGKPQAAYPIYMVWGRSKWMDTMLDEITLSTTMEIQVPLSLFREDVVSFTYPDSMVSFLLNLDRNPEYYLPEYHGRVFTLSEMRAILESNGLPGFRWGTELPRDMANYVEAQVWDHEPLLAYLRQVNR